MENNNFNPKKAFQLTRMIYFAIIAGSLAFMIFVFYFTSDNFFFRLDLSDPFSLVLLIMCISSIMTAYVYSRNTIKKIDPNDLFKKKFPVYQSGLIVRLAIAEGLALFATVVLLITNNLFNIIFFFIALLLMLSYYPTPDRIGKEINLTQSEIEQFY